MTRKILATSQDFDPSVLFQNLDEKEKKELMSNCSLIIKNPSFKKICDELSTKNVLDTIDESETIERLHFGRGKIGGIAEVFDTILGYHLEHVQSVTPDEDFDKNEVI